MQVRRRAMLRLVEASPEERALFGRAVSEELGTTPRKELAAQVAKLSGESVSESAVSQWITGTNEPTRRKVFAIEKALGVQPGTLSRHLGYLPVDAVPA